MATKYESCCSKVKVKGQGQKVKKIMKVSFQAIFPQEVWHPDIIYGTKSCYTNSLIIDNYFNQRSRSEVKVKS